MQCLNCGGEFEPKRASAKFCSGKCRIAYLRKVSVTDSGTVSVTKERVSVTKPVSVTAQEFISGTTMPVSVTAQKQVSVTSVPKSEVLPPCGANFTPLWEKKGFKSQADGWKHVIKCLMDNKKRINNTGTGEPAVLYLINYKITLV